MIDCKGQYGGEEQFRLFALPKNDVQRQKWINKIPSFSSISVSSQNFRICNRHWPADTPMVTIPGGSTRPVLPPSIFFVPASCLPTPKPDPRPAKPEFALQSCFDQKDKFLSYEEFFPEKELKKKYKEMIFIRTEEKYRFILMNEECTKNEMTITVFNKQTLCSPAVVCAFKEDFKVPIPRTIIDPNSGISRYSQLFEVVNFTVQYEVPVNLRLRKIAERYDSVMTSYALDEEKLRKVGFVKRQAKLLSGCSYVMKDFCFAIY